ncbi:LptF/LptG family permease [Asaia prunellae]|uniref:LptF/LptG family permease n=1 Tax=Asaia prunellae TaxID=610245 RepID=UPI000A5EC8B1|nr:LptF/LptG family permease [Asaia prunellae]
MARSPITLFKGSSAGVSVTLSLYISRIFTLFALAMIAALTGLVSLFDFIDLLRRVATKPDVPTSLVTEIAGLHVPYFMIMIMPFGILLGGIVCFWRLTRSSELIVARAAGISAWQFLAAPLACAILLGTFGTMLCRLFPLRCSARPSCLTRPTSKQVEGPYRSMVAPCGYASSMMIRAHMVLPFCMRVMFSSTIEDCSSTISAFSVSMHMTSLWSALNLHEGNWWKERGSSRMPRRYAPIIYIHIGDYLLPTNLSLTRVEQSFASPDTLSVWTLPGFIRLLERSGFSSIRHRLHFQTLLALPILCGTMALVSAGFSMRPSRRGGVARMLGSGIAAGFALFTISKVAAQFGESGALPPVMAAWAPTGAGLCLAVALLLHLEDG